MNRWFSLGDHHGVCSAYTLGIYSPCYFPFALSFVIAVATLPAVSCGLWQTPQGVLGTPEQSCPTGHVQYRNVFLPTSRLRYFLAASLAVESCQGASL